MRFYFWYWIITLFLNVEVRPIDLYLEGILWNSSVNKGIKKIYLKFSITHSKQCFQIIFQIKLQFLYVAYQISQNSQWVPKILMINLSLKKRKAKSMKGKYTLIKNCWFYISEYRKNRLHLYFVKERKHEVRLNS